MYNSAYPSLTTFNGWGEGYCVDFDNSFRFSSLHPVQQNYKPRIWSTKNVFFADTRFLIITALWAHSKTIMIRFILLWDQKWEANSIVSVYMHDEASKQIFNTDWEFHPFFSFFIIFFLLFNLRKSKPSVGKKKASRNLLNQNNLLRKKYKSDRRLWHQSSLFS